MDESTQTKTCTKCGETKSLDEYHALRTAADGHRTACKVCAIAAAKAWATRSKACEKPAPLGDKRCTKCQTIKPRSEFHVRRNSTDGRANRCKPCSIADRHTYRAENPEKVARAGRLWRDRNPGYSAAVAKAWREANPERKLEYGRRWAEENAEKLAALKRAWYLANRELVLSYPSRFPERTRMKYRKYRQAHPERAAEHNQRRRARKLGASVGEVDLEALWTGDCGICDEPIDPVYRWPDPMSRSIDHIVPIARGGAHAQANLQLAHLICNMRKGARIPSDVA